MSHKIHEGLLIVHKGMKRNRLLHHIDVFLCSRCGFLPVFPVQDCSPVLVELEGENNDVAWVDADGCGGTVRLVSLDAIDVDDPFFAVNLCDFALATLVFASNDPNFVIFANRY